MKKLKTFLQPDGTYRYQINAPAWVVDREERPHYEKDRFASMEANLKRGDVLFDVGAELGWQSCIYAQFVGPENMILIERVMEFWPTIKDTWEANFDVKPKATFPGFASFRTRASFEPDSFRDSWPHVAYFPKMENFVGWKDFLMCDTGSEVALDKLFAKTTVVNAITIDVEGAELKVLFGAEKILAEQRPLVWVSVHPAQRLAAFGAKKHEIFELMAEHGYQCQYLGVDHEEHYFFYPAERASQVTLVDSPWGTYGKRDVTFEQAMPDWKDSDGMPYTAAWANR